MIPVESLPPLVAPVPVNVAAVLSNTLHEQDGDRALAPHEHHDFERLRRDGRKARSSVPGPYEQRAPRSAVGPDRGFADEVVGGSGAYTPGDGLREPQAVDRDSFGTALERALVQAKDDVLTPAERRAFDQAVGVGNSEGLFNRSDWKRLAQLHQHVLEKMGLGRLGRKLRDNNLVGLAQAKATALVAQLERSADSITDVTSLDSLKPLVDTADGTDTPFARAVIFGAGIAACAHLRRRGNHLLATVALLFGMLEGCGPSSSQPEAPQVTSAFTFVDMGNGRSATALDNYPVMSSAPAESVGPLMNISPERAPNFRALSGAMFSALKKYPDLEPTSWSYQYIPADPDGRGDFEGLFVSTRQKTGNNEPLFLVAQMNEDGSLTVTTVVKRDHDRVWLKFDDGKSREVEVEDVYVLLERGQNGEYVYGPPMQVSYKDPFGRFKAMIVHDGTDNEELVFLWQDKGEGESQGIGGGGGKFGPNLALFRPAHGIPAPTEVAVVGSPTPAPTETLTATITSQPPTETPTAVPTPDLGPPLPNALSEPIVCTGLPQRCIDDVVSAIRASARALSAEVRVNVDSDHTSIINSRFAGQMLVHWKSDDPMSEIQSVSFYVLYFPTGEAKDYFAIIPTVINGEKINNTYVTNNQPPYAIEVAPEAVLNNTTIGEKIRSIVLVDLNGYKQHPFYRDRKDFFPADPIDTVIKALGSFMQEGTDYTVLFMDGFWDDLNAYK